MNEDSRQALTAPTGAFVWSDARGWISDPINYDEARFEGELLLEKDDDNIVRGIEGEASLKTLMRVDGDIYYLGHALGELAAEVKSQYEKFLQIAEYVANELLPARGTQRDTQDD